MAKQPRISAYEQRQMDLKKLEQIKKNGGLLRNYKPPNRRKKSKRPGRILLRVSNER